MKKVIAIMLLAAGRAWAAEDFPKPYTPPCVERENVFELTEKPKVKNLGNDKYEITFAVKGNCDVTVGIVDSDGKVVRHLGAGVLGANAPAPFQKNSLRQTIYWNGKDDLDVYHKTPEELRVRVMLGLKPVFDKRLGGTSPYNLPGYVCGLAVGPDGAYVINKEWIGAMAGFTHATIRKFDRDGKYVQMLVSPPAGLPESKLGGMGYVEYELGKRAVFGADIANSLQSNGNGGYLPPLDGAGVDYCQPALVGDRLFFANIGQCLGSPGSFLHYIYTDGSTDVRGINGVPFVKGAFHNMPMLAVSPDGKKIYLCAGYNRNSSYTEYGVQVPCLYVTTPDGVGPCTVFAGEVKKPGSDNQHFGGVTGIDCDAQGRVYASDGGNNRVQILSPEGKHLKTIPVDRPGLVCVHKKTGAIYVQHQARVQGLSVSRLTKFVSFDDPWEEFHLDGPDGWMALDSWGPKPRLWVADVIPSDRDLHYLALKRVSVTIWEERGKTLEKIRDFEAEARQEPGWFKKWRCAGELGSSKSVCDPTREKLYYSNSCIFDLATGAFEGALSFPYGVDDIAFDKRGYLHAHFNPGSLQGVGRFDPARKYMSKDRNSGKDAGIVYPECPYDYGIEKENLLGVLPVRDQCGAPGFQMGLGVTMRGEVAENSCIYYVPKMEEVGDDLAFAGAAARGETDWRGGRAHAMHKKAQLDREKQGEGTYSIRREPGIPLAGGTVWTFDRSGELRKECAVIAGNLINGVQLDEDLSVYFVNNRSRVYEDKPFLSGKAGHFGRPESKPMPFTGTLIKTKPDTRCRILSSNAPVPMDALPNRPAELSQYHENAWVEGAEWLYAGASPIVPGGCVCPAQRLHLDWYKRVYVPEAYRHSFAILDTNGNLIQHVGQYANFDNAPGGPRGCRPGETDIGMTAVCYIGGTDNYLAFEDWGERIVVLKLNYHAEESVGIGGQ